jgi:catechol-2,3-dioxygenase
MNKITSQIKGLGEVSIRVKNLDEMHRFYEKVLGLEVLRREEGFIFYKITDGYEDHPQIFALFAATERWMLESKSTQLSSEQTTLHHIAFNVSIHDFDSLKKHFEDLGIKVYVTDHPWLHIRSQYFSDPEGNLLEFVCYDENVN